MRIQILESDIQEALTQPGTNPYWNPLAIAYKRERKAKKGVRNMFVVRDRVITQTNSVYRWSTTTKRLVRYLTNWEERRIWTEDSQSTQHEYEANPIILNFELFPEAHQRSYINLYAAYLTAREFRRS